MTEKYSWNERGLKTILCFSVSCPFPHKCFRSLKRISLWGAGENFITLVWNPAGQQIYALCSTGKQRFRTQCSFIHFLFTYKVFYNPTLQSPTNIIKAGLHPESMSWQPGSNLCKVHCLIYSPTWCLSVCDFIRNCWHTFVFVFLSFPIDFMLLH